MGSNINLTSQGFKNLIWAPVVKLYCKGCKGNTEQVIPGRKHNFISYCYATSSTLINGIRDGSINTIIMDPYLQFRIKCINCVEETITSLGCKRFPITISQPLRYERILRSIINPTYIRKVKSEVINKKIRLNKAFEILTKPTGISCSQDSFNNKMKKVLKKCVGNQQPSSRVKLGQKHRRGPQGAKELLNTPEIKGLLKGPLFKKITGPAHPVIIPSTTSPVISKFFEQSKIQLENLRNFGELVDTKSLNPLLNVPQWVKNKCKGQKYKHEIYSLQGDNFITFGCYSCKRLELSCEKLEVAQTL